MNSVSIQVVKDQFPIKLTLSDDDTSELLTRLNSCLNWLRQNGYSQPQIVAGPEPTPAQNGGPPHPAQLQQQTIPGIEQAPTCPYHSKQMKKSQFDDSFYCPTKLPTGEYCPHKS